jgi:hypothetical protein
LKEEESIKEGVYVPDGIVPVCEGGFVRRNLKLFQKLWENVLEFLVPLALRTVGMTFVKKHH